MKKTALMAALLLVGAAAFATEGPKKKNTTSTSKIALIQNSPERYKLVYLDQNEGSVHLQLRDGQGKVVFSEHIKNKEGFAQPLNFKNMPDGEYTIEVKSTTGELMKEVLAVERPAAGPSFVADLLNVNDSKKFRLIVFDKQKKALPVNINIYNEAGDQVHSESVKDVYSFRKIYDLQDLQGETFRFVISNKTGYKTLLAGK